MVNQLRRRPSGVKEENWPYEVHTSYKKNFTPKPKFTLSVSEGKGRVLRQR